MSLFSTGYPVILLTEHGHYTEVTSQPSPVFFTDVFVELIFMFNSKTAASNLKMISKTTNINIKIVINLSIFSTLNPTSIQKEVRKIKFLFSFL